MRVGVLIIPEDRWPEAGGKWRRAEEMGFDHAWTYDHLAWRQLRDSPWFSAVPTLTAAAAVTASIRLGTLVASPSFRHPVSFARELVTLDDVARGRVTLGIGAGAEGWDDTILGEPAPSLRVRTERFAEFVDMLDRLLRQPETTYEGKYWTADEARTYPGCVQQPRMPFAVAATRPKGLAVVARHADVWVTNGERDHTGPLLGAEDGAAVVARQRERLDEACAAVGRDPATIDTLVLTGPRLDAGMASAAKFQETKDAYAAVGVTDLVVHWPRPSEPYAGDEGQLELCRP